MNPHPNRVRLVISPIPHPFMATLIGVCMILVCLYSSVGLASPGEMGHQATQIMTRNISVTEDGDLLAYIGFLGSKGQPIPSDSIPDLTVEVDGVVVDSGLTQVGFEASGRGLAVLLAVDISGTMKKAMPALRRTLSGFTTTLRPGIDHVALGSIGNDWQLLYPFTNRPSEIQATIKSLEATALTTALFESIYQGVQLLARADETLPSRRLMVVVSDGLNEKAGRTAQECVDVATKEYVQVHSLIYLTRRTERYLEAKGALEKISRDTGAGTETVSTAGRIGPALEELRKAISYERVLKISAKVLPLDGGRHELTLKSGQTEVRLQFRTPKARLPLVAQPPTKAEPEPKTSNRSLLAIALGGGILLLLLIAVGIRRRNRSHSTTDRRTASGPAQEDSTRNRHFRVIDGLEGVTEIDLPRSGGRIGYEPDNEIVLNSDSVSSHHAELLPTTDELAIRDLGSTNGTYVDEVRVGAAPVVLRMGASVRIGLVVLVFE